MATIEKGDVQILVHTSAPSTGRDDTRYRDLAHGYLKFEPVNHRVFWDELEGEESSQEERLEDERERVDDEADESSCQLQQELQLSTQGERSSEASYQPEDDPEPETASTAVSSTQDRDLVLAGHTRWAYSPPMSFQSVMGNLDSPPIRDRNASNNESPVGSTQRSNGPWEQPPGIISDSQPELVIASTQPSSPSWVWKTVENLLEKSHAASAQTEIDEIRSLVIPSSSADSDLDQRKDIKPFQATLSGHLSSTSTPEKARNSGPALKSRSFNILSQEQMLPLKRKEASLLCTNISSSVALDIDAATISTTKEIMSKSSKRICLSECQTQGLQIGAAPQTYVEYSQAVASCNVESSIMELLVEEESNIREPRVDASRIENSRSTPSSRISSSKATEVATPCSSSPTSLWANILEVRPPPPKTSQKALKPENLITTSLQQFVHKFPADSIYQPERQARELRPMERGYWLVTSQAWDARVKRSFWCYVAAFVNKGHGGWGMWSVRDEDFKSIRVYCWGITVRHVYLLLHISSGNKIKGTGARWIDGRGEDIITMPSAIRL